MKNDLDKLILGFVLGGLVGGSMFYLLRATDKERRLFYNKIQTIGAEIGDLLKNMDTEDKHETIEKWIENLPKNGNAANFLALVGAGINLWKKGR